MAGYITLGVLILGMVVEITPIKINPISWFGKHFNRDIDNKLKVFQEEYNKNHQEVLNKIEETNKRIDSTNTRIDENDIASVRTRIASIGTIVKSGGELTDDQFKCAFKDIDTWAKYHKIYPELNGIINASIEMIKDSYKSIK